MKKYITAALLFCAALTAACSKETAGSADTGDTGALEMRVSATRAEADGEYDPLQRLAVRIYRASGELLRQYTAETLPSRLELLAGEYRVEVDAGEAVPASFTKRFYKGEKTFTVAAGQTTVAEVECKRQNVVAEVKFDATVSAAFGENFHAWVVAADAFDEGQVQQGGVPALNYTADGTGYFTMPEGATRSRPASRARTPTAASSSGGQIRRRADRRQIQRLLSVLERPAGLHRMLRRQGGHLDRRLRRHVPVQPRAEHRKRRFRHGPAAGFHPRDNLPETLHDNHDGRRKERRDRHRRRQLRSAERHDRGRRGDQGERLEPDGHPFRRLLPQGVRAAAIR